MSLDSSRIKQVSVFIYIIFYNMWVTWPLQIFIGSRYFQEQLKKSTPYMIEFLLNEVSQDMAKIMKNQYGNYFF